MDIEPDIRLLLLADEISLGKLTVPLIEKGTHSVRRTAWYAKSLPTFSDAMALVRLHVWDHIHFSTSQEEDDLIKIPRSLLERFLDVMSYAA